MEIWVGLLNGTDDEFLGFPVGIGDHVDGSLVLDVEARPQLCLQKRSGPSGGVDRELERFVHGISGMSGSIQTMMSITQSIVKTDMVQEVEKSGSFE